VIPTAHAPPALNFSLTSYAPHDPLRELEHKVTENILFRAFVKRAENSSTACCVIMVMENRRTKDWGYCFDCGVSVKGVLRLTVFKADFPQDMRFPKAFFVLDGS